MEKKEIARNVFIIDAGLASGAGACGGGGTRWGDSQGSGKYCFFKKRGENLEETQRQTLGSEEAVVIESDRQQKLCTCLN